MNSTPKITCSVAESQSAIGSSINRIHAIMARLSDSIEYADSALSPVLRPAEANNSPEDCRPIESDLHRELLNIEAKAERALFAIDQLRFRSTL